jgi:hypothetical protein
MVEELKEEIKLVEGEFDLNEYEMELLKEKFPESPQIKKLNYLEQIEIKKYNMNSKIKKVVIIMKGLIHGKILQQKFLNF